MKQFKIKVLAICMLSILVVSCTDKDKEDVIVADDSEQGIISQYLNIDLSNIDNYTDINYPVHYDANVLQNDNTPITNPLTDLGATLGRVLFYDQSLSVNNTISCASCHKQNLGFVDDAVLSEGFEGGETGAHSMRIPNANFYTGDAMFWDKRASNLEEQSTMPIQDPVEMGYDEAHGGFAKLISKMQSLEYYPILFKKVYQSEEITEDKAQKALAQFMRSMVSINSIFDEGFAQAYRANAPGAGVGVDFQNFTAQENAGKQLFLAPANAGGAGCAGCHNPPTFALAANSLSNGLDMGETTIFKSPSLKNVGLTGPYMHDGRFETLEEVVEHYNSGVLMGPSLDNRLRTAPPMPTPVRLNLTADQKAALVAFLKTLNDNELTQDQRFSNPFK